ncbi:MAG: FtsW/RodA/SpoVE family cell cycle protein [Aquificae bacterium]|nr:FtsW/RodA/SpoVE family cell cycle protein [Aquificota bacterium]
MSNYDRILHYFILLLTLTGIVLIFSAYSLPRIVQTLVYGSGDWTALLEPLKPYAKLLIAYAAGFGAYWWLLRADLRRGQKLFGARAINLLVWATAALMVAVVVQKFVFGLSVNRWLLGPYHTVLITGLIILTYYLFLAYQFSKEKVNWPKVVFVSLLYALLLLAQPDVGTLLLLTFSFLVLSFFRFDHWIPKAAFYAATGLALLFSTVAVVSAALNARLSLQLPNFLAETPFEHVVVRINNWLDPFSDVTDRSYQLANSLYAIHKGGLTGEGYGFGMRKLYMGGTVHTDFIFATVGEELGFVFALFLFVLTLLLLLRLLNLAYRFRSNFERFFTLLVAVETFALALVNAGMAANLLPAKGWPYPLVSYAPFFALFYLVQLGVVQFFVRRRFHEVL